MELSFYIGSILNPIKAFFDKKRKGDNGMAMCTALEAANYLVYLMKGAVDDLSNMKLNKLLYYAQGQCLKQTGEPLFNDDIEAWQYGPLIKNVYQRYRSFGNEPITECDDAAAKSIGKQVATLLLNTAREYGRFSAFELKDKTHEKNGPWDTTYSKCGNRAVISNESIKDYFLEHEETAGDLQIDFKDSDFVGRRDSDGVLVLPKGWDE